MNYMLAQRKASNLVSTNYLEDKKWTTKMKGGLKSGQLNFRQVGD